MKLQSRELILVSLLDSVYELVTNMHSDVDIVFKTKRGNEYTFDGVTFAFDKVILKFEDVKTNEYFHVQMDDVKLKDYEEHPEFLFKLKKLSTIFDANRLLAENYENYIRDTYYLYVNGVGSELQSITSHRNKIFYNVKCAGRKMSYTRDMVDFIMELK